MAASKGPRVRQTIRWQMPLSRALEIVAIQREENFNDIVNAALREYLERHYPAVFQEAEEESRVRRHRG